MKFKWFRLQSWEYGLLVLAAGLFFLAACDPFGRYK